MSSRSLCRWLSTAIVVCTTPLVSQTVSSQHPPSIISLDHTFMSPAADVVPVRGEASFANTPDNFYAFASARVAEPAPVEAVHLRFSRATTITSIQSTKDFPIEPGSSCATGNSYVAGDTCIVLMRFTPQGAGRRLGKLTIGHSGSVTPDAFGLGGYGYAPIVTFNPAYIGTVPGTYPSSKGLLSGATDLVVDGGDILYIDDMGNNLLREIDSTGAITNVSPFFGTPTSIAVDNFGNVWAPTVSGSTFYFTNYLPSRTQAGWSAPSYTPGSCTDSAPCNLINVGLGNPAEISIDSNDNLFMEEETRGALEMPVGGWVDITSTLNLWYLEDVYAYYLGPPSTFAVSANDDLFTAISYSFQNDCSIVEEPLYGAEGSNPTYTRVAGGINCGYSGNGGQAAGAEIGGAIGQIAFDVAGDLYFSDSNNQRVRMINASSGIITSIAGTGVAGYTGDANAATSARLSYPTGVAVDSQGQVYIVSGTGTTSGGAQVVRKLGPKGYLVFGSQTQGVSSTAHLVAVTNTGNSNLVLTSVKFTGTDPSDFSIDPNTTNCLLTAGATLYSGQTCNVGVIFKPGATGTRTANLVFLDNSLANSNTVLLQGTGTASAPSFSPPSLTFPSTTVNQSASASVTVTNNGNANLTVSSITIGGTNPKMFTSANTCSGKAVAPKATCTLTVTYKPTAAGSDSAILKIADNSPGSPHSVSVAGTGLTPASSSVKVTSSANPASGCAPVVFSVAVSGTGGRAPTGAVNLKSGARVLATAELVDGAAKLTTSGLASGANLLTAAYSGDAVYGPSASPSFTQVVATSDSCRGMQPLTSASQ